MSERSEVPDDQEVSAPASGEEAVALPFSLVIVAKDAAACLPACIASVPFAAEVLVVDSGSSDNTVALARELGARLLVQEWLGYGRQKQYAVEQARHDWVLCLDADEALTPELAAAIQAALLQPAFAAYRFPRRNRFMGRDLVHGAAYPDWCLRLFDRRQARWSFDPVGEQVQLSPGASCGPLAGDLLHDPAEVLEDYLARQNHFSTLAAEHAFARGKGAGSLRLVLGPLLRFLRCYLLRQGFRDGVPGLAYAAIDAFSLFSKYIKLRELARTAAGRQRG